MLLGLLLVMQSGLSAEAIAWNKCLEESVDRYATSTNEPAASVVVAAFGQCREQEELVRTEEAYRLEAKRGSWDDLDRLMMKIRQIQRERLTARALGLRSK